LIVARVKWGAQRFIHGGSVGGETTALFAAERVTGRQFSTADASAGGHDHRSGEVGIFGKCDYQLNFLCDGTKVTYIRLFREISSLDLLRAAPASG